LLSDEAETRRYMQQYLKKQERAVIMHGDLQGIAGKSLQKIDGLELQSSRMTSDPKEIE